MDIDRKYEIVATSRKSGKVYTHEHGVFFKASDAAFNRAVLDGYKRELIRLNAHPRQIRGVDLLIERIEKYKGLHPEFTKTPDVDPGEENEYVNAPNE